MMKRVIVTLILGTLIWVAWDRLWWQGHLPGPNFLLSYGFTDGEAAYDRISLTILLCAMLISACLVYFASLIRSNPRKVGK